MTFLVALFGVLVAGVGVFGVVRPVALVRFLESIWESSWVFYFAIGIRIALGAVLIIAAPECRFPQTIRILGMISLIGAASIAAMGLARLRAFVAWWLGRPAGFIRGWSGLAFAFGAFLIYASC